MNFLPKLTVLGGLVASLFVGGQVTAAPCAPATTVGALVACDIVVGGTTYTIDNFAASATIPAASTVIITAAGSGLSMVVVPAVGAFTPVGQVTGFFDYRLTAQGANSRLFNTVALSSTVSLFSQQGAVTVQKSFLNAQNTPFGTPLVNNGGIEANEKLVFPDVFTVHDTFIIDPLALLVSFSNTFTLVPEPASLALLGVGLVGLGALRRRRAAAP